jgi:hypothetical protein
MTRSRAIGSREADHRRLIDQVREQQRAGHELKYPRASARARAGRTWVLHELAWPRWPRHAPGGE